MAVALSGCVITEEKGKFYLLGKDIGFVQDSFFDTKKQVFTW